MFDSDMFMPAEQYELNLLSCFEDPVFRLEDETAQHPAPGPRIPDQHLAPVDEPILTEPREMRRDGYANSRYPWRSSSNYWSLAQIGLEFKGRKLINVEITEIIRAFRREYVLGDDELGRGVRYLGPITAWLDQHWDEYGDQICGFAREWCFRKWCWTNKQ